MFHPDEERSYHRALLIGIDMPETPLNEAETLLEELEDLVKTLGVEIGGARLTAIKKPNPKLLIGTGKAEELVALAKAKDCDLIVFDNELTPAQQRNWERLADLRVMDRQEVILEIFSDRAKTREAVLQVELARLEYSLPRLKRAWTHLSRQRGGASTQRGEGETQLQLDQRMIRKQISKLKTELKEVVQHRQLQRKRRARVPLPTAALVGYTNAGKSSLLNVLTGAEVLAEDKLFATLDPTTRRLKLPSGQILLMTDTVGFVRRLPHRLVEAFKATLEEAVESDFLVHMIDATSPDLENHVQTTLGVLEELGATSKPRITVLNKIDLIKDPVKISELRARFPDGLFISSKNRIGLDQLQARLDEMLDASSNVKELLIPHDRYDLVSQLYRAGAVSEENPRNRGVYIRGCIPDRLMEACKDFILPEGHDLKQVVSA